MEGGEKRWKLLTRLLRVLPALVVVVVCAVLRTPHSAVLITKDTLPTDAVPAAIPMSPTITRSIGIELSATSNRHILRNAGGLQCSLPAFLYTIFDVKEYP